MCIYDIYDIYIYLFQTWKTLKEGLYEPFVLSWHHLTELRTIWANLQKTGELDSGISGRLTVSTQIYCQTGWGMWGPCLATKQKTDPLDGPTAPLSKWSNFLCHNWRIEAPQAFLPLSMGLVHCRMFVPIKVTREGSYKQNLTKYVTIKWSLLLGGVERPHSICCNTWTTTRCCCSSTLPLKPAIVAKRLYTRCFHVFSR